MGENLKLDASQIWDVWVGSQSPAEFMEFEPNDTVEIAVNDYVENCDFFKQEISDEVLTHVRTKLIEYIEMVLEGG